MSLSYDPFGDILSESIGIAKFFTPSSVAIIGATEKENSVGKAITFNLIKGGYEGDVYPINPKYKTLFDSPCYPDIQSCPLIDLAIIVTPAKTVPDLVKACTDHHVKAIIIIAAGFKELGEPGIKLEQELLSYIKGTKTRIIGPNCLGVMNPLINLNATFATKLAPKGNIAFISQSGAMCSSVLDWSIQENIGFSAFVSIGSMSDVNWGDLIEYFGRDPHTQSILIYMETVGDARDFLSAARKVAFTKPIIVIKPGKTEAAAKAAASHTGSLAGSDEILSAAFNRVGVMRVDTIEDLFDMANVLTKQPQAQGPSLTIITNAGGPSVLATDSLEINGGSVTKLSKDRIDQLSTFLPPAWSHANPVDILGDAGAKTYAKSLDVISKDDTSDGILVILTPQDMSEPTQTAKEISHYNKLSKPILASWMGGESVEGGFKLLNQSNIPCFKYPDQAAKIFALMAKRKQMLDSIFQTPTLPIIPHFSENSRSIIESAYLNNVSLLTELQSKQVLKSYNIPAVTTLLADSEDASAKAAASIGYPVVLKLHSETITHKTDVGGVQLNLKNEKQVRKAYQTIKENLIEKESLSHFQGVTVQPMVNLKGYELILGSKIDPQFGPVIVFGSGGELVEVIKDSAIGFPPLNEKLAQELIEKTKIYTALKGVRGKKPVNLDLLKTILVQFSYLIAENPEIAECDINPFIASEEKIIALDARIILHPKSASLPKLAIRSYPHQYTQKIQCANIPITIRYIRAEDQDKLIAFHKKVSQKNVEQNFPTFPEEKQRICKQRLIQICNIDYARDIRLVATNAKEEIIGFISLIRFPNTNKGEMKMLVIDQMENSDLRKILVNKLIDIAKKEGFSQIRAIIHKDSKALHDLLKEMAFTFYPLDKVVKAILKLVNE